MLSQRETLPAAGPCSGTSTDALIQTALCDALPGVLDALANYARASSGRNAALVWSLRQAGLILLGALEQAAGRDRTFPPKHVTREREIRILGS
jgi:hypothetical protein